MHQLNWAILTRSFNPTDAKTLLSNMRIHCLGGLEAYGTKLGRADYGLIPRVLQLDRKVATLLCQKPWCYDQNH